jgi:multidrug efflux pump subunit AcrB
MIRFLIYRPVSVVVIYLACCLLAIWRLGELPASLLPDIDIPEISILVEQEGFTALEIDNRLLQPLRQRLLQVGGINRMESSAGHETGVIRLRFNYGRDIDYAFLEVNEKVDLSLSQIPEGVSRPRVVRASAGELPAFYLSLSYQQSDSLGSSSMVELSDFADQIVRRRLEQLEAVALVDINGLRAKQIVIRPRRDLFVSLGLDQYDIQQALETANLSLGTIRVKERQYEYIMRLGQPLSSVEDIRKSALRIGERVFTLEELAEVRLLEQPPRGTYLFNGQPGINLAVIKNSEARTKDLEREVDEVIHVLQNENPDIRFEKNRDQLFLLNYSISNLRQSLLLGGFLATLIIFLFYRNWRIPAIIAVILPLSVLLSLLFFDLFSLSIDIISLSGIILGLGLMIDNGIIVLDNIGQFSEKEPSIAQACIQGTNEMIRPLLSSMLTTCSVFLPLILLSGLAGALFWSQAIAVSIGLTISYLISITLLPVLYFVLIKNREKLNQSIGRASFWQKAYHWGFHWSFRYPVLIVAFAVLFVFGGWFFGRNLAFQQLPEIPQTAFEMYLDWNEPIRTEAAEERLLELFTKLPDPRPAYYAHIGQQQYLLNYDPEQQSSVVHIYIAHENEDDGKRLQFYLDSLLEVSFPTSSRRFLAEKTIFEQLFPTGETSLNIGLRLPGGSSESRQLEAYHAFSKSLKSAYPQVILKPPVLEEQVILVPNREKLLLYDISSDQLFEELQSALNSRNLLRLYQGNNTIPVVVSNSGRDLDQMLREFQIVSSEGQRIPVQYLIRQEKQQSLRRIYASRNGQYLPIQIRGLAPEQVIAFLDQYERQRPEVNFELSGPYLDNQLLFDELLKVMLVSLLLLFFIMAAQFESLLQPLIILVEIPISLSGSLIVLYLGGSSLNAMAFIGMVVTAGIIINDSIIKIDTINRLRRSGQYSIREAIHEGGKKRVNPIIMTSLTSILAVIPFLWGQDLGASLQKPLALALIGGMTVGTMVSLWLIPLLYALIYKKY